MNMFRKLRNNIGAVIFIAILGLVFMGATYVNLGPTSLIDGDIGVTAGHSYYVGDVEMVKYSKFDATSAPTVNNDVDEGYKIGSHWFDITNDRAYICLDNTDGAAVWTETSGNVSTSGAPVQYDYARFANGTDIEGRSYTETKEDLDVDDLENTTNALNSAGIVTGGVVTTGTNAGTFKVTAITEAYLRTSAIATAPLTSVTLAEQDDQTITAANTTYFVIFTYGTPCTITTSGTAPNGYNAIPLGKVMKDSSNTVHYIDGGFRFGDGVRKLHQRAKTLREIELNSGSAIEYSGTNNFTMDTGIAYVGLNSFSLATYNSATTTFTAIYWDGTSAWKDGTLIGTDIAIVDGGVGNDSITQTAALFVSTGYVVGDKITISGSVADDGTYTILAVTAGTIEVATDSFVGEAAGEEIILRAGRNVIDFAHYDDGDGTLGNVGVARYGVHYVYKHIDDDDVYVVYGTDSYTLAEAEIAAIIPPTIPNHLTDFGCLIGAIIAPQSGGSFTAVIMVTSQFFSGTEVANHANLANLDYVSSGHTGFQPTLTNSAGLINALSDETGTGKAVFGTSPTFTTKITTPIIDLTGGQVAFPTSQSASADANTLDDYEEGTYEPTLTCSISGSYTLNADYDTLAYTKIGRMVHIQGQFQVTSETSPNGSLTLSLPFASLNLTELSDIASGIVVIQDHGGSIDKLFATTGGGDSFVRFRQFSTLGSVSFIDHDDVDTNFWIFISIWYLAE